MQTDQKNISKYHIQDTKFFISHLNKVPEKYLNGVERDEFFEMIWYKRTEGDRNQFPEHPFIVYLIPPYRATKISINKQEGYLIAFKREYLEEDDKEYALDVFNLFNQQGQHSVFTIDVVTQQNLEHLVALILFEMNNSFGAYLIIKSLLKVFLLHLIRLTQSVFLKQDVNQKRVYEFCVLLDQYYIKERKAGFYASKLGLSEKRLNQVLSGKMNKTITDLIHARLILEAKRKLTASELTIKEIAFALYFEDHSYFSRFFKKQTGLSPEEFKKDITGSVLLK